MWRQRELRRVQKHGGPTAFLVLSCEGSAKVGPYILISDDGNEWDAVVPSIPYFCACLCPLHLLYLLYLHPSPQSASCISTPMAIKNKTKQNQ